MSLGPSDKPRRRRRLTDEEHKLWSGVARSVVPLKRKPAGPRRHDPAPAAAAGEAVPAGRRRAEPTLQRQAAAKPVLKPGPKPALPVLRLERRQKQRLGRGSEPIDGRIDLHGKTQSEAHAALLGFLRRAQAEGARFVLVITGKGGVSGAGAERGVLKRQVPLWLRQGEFRACVLAAEDAHRSHGGEGALYVRLRRAP